MISATASRTDNLMDTEVAAIARQEYAERSLARRRAEDEERHRQYADLQRRCRTTTRRIDADIDNEAAGARRAELAAQSARRRAQQAEQTRLWNTHLKERIAAATDHNELDEEKERYQKLIAHSNLTRGSDVSAATWITYQNYETKMQAAEECRQEKARRDELRNQQRDDWLAYGKELSLNRAIQMERNKQIKGEMEESNQAESERLRREVGRWQEVKDKKADEYMVQARERVEAKRGLGSRLDAFEEAVGYQEIFDGSQMRAEIASNLRVVREEDLELKKAQVAAIREHRRQNHRDSAGQSAREMASRAQAKREEMQAWNTQKQQQEEQYLQVARANKAAAVATKAKIKASATAVQKRKKQDADRVRNATVDPDFDTAMQGIAARKREVRDAYQKRYVGADEARQWYNSPLHRLHAAAHHVLSGLLGGSEAKSH